MTNYYNSLCSSGDTVHKKTRFGASGGSPNTTKTPRWWLASLFMVMSLFMGQFVRAQVSYSQTWATTGLNSWTGSTFSRTTANICGTTGSIRGERYYGNSAQFTSPSLGTSNGGLITMTYQYKVVDWSAGTTATSAANVGTITLEYGSTTTGPWTIAQTINSSNHVASNVCATKTATFTPPTGALYVRFNVVSSLNNDSYYYFDDVAVSQGAAPTCFSPTALAVGSVTSNSASLTWTAPASGTTPANYEYEVRTSGVAGSGASGLAFSGSPTTNSAALTGLSANTPYSVYVRSFCGGSDYSAWTPASTFTTPCNAVTSFPWNETFETASPTIGCFRVIDGNADGDAWTIATTNPRTGTRHASMYTDFNSANNDYLITPQLVLDTQPKRLTFWVRANSASEPDEISIRVSTTGTAITDFSNVALASTPVNSITYYKITVDLSAFVNQTVYLAFVRNAAPADGWYVYVDDVTVENLPSCFESTGLTASSITNNSASLAWTAPTSGTTPIGYEYEVRTSGAAGSGATGLAFSGNPTTNSAALSGLTANTSYSVYVRTQCSVSEFSVWTTATSFKTSCDAVSTFPYNEGFESITVANTLPSCMTSSPVVASGGKVQTYIAAGSNSALVARTGSKYAAVYWSPSATAGYVFSAPLQLIAGKAYDASVFYKTDGVAWTDATIYWGTSATTGAMTNTIATVANAAATAYTEIKGSFSVPTTGVYYLAVRGYNATSSPNYIAFDDLSVTELPDCSATPNNGVAVIPSASGCSGLILNLSATGLTTGLAGISYQWQSSPDDTNWTDISGATAATYSLTTVSGLTYYRVNTTCTPTATTSNSSSVSYTGTICTYDTTRSTGVTFTSIMPANGGSGLAFPGWQSTTSGDDNVTTTQALTGTTFKYQGQTVEGMQACSNGWMTFNTANTSYPWTNDLTSATSSNNATFTSLPFNRVLAPFWDDLVFTGGSYANRDNSVRYKVDGALGSGSAVITVEWAGVERFSIPGPNLNFQVKLYESDNHIEYIYGTFEGFDGSVTSAYSYSIGMNGSNPAGTSTVDHLVLQTPNENHFGATNNTNQIIMPTCNTMYSFVPGVYSGLTSAPAAVAPANDNSAGATSLTVLGAPATSYCGTYYNSRNATDSGAGLPTCLTTALTAGDQDDDVWFKFTTTATTDYVVKLRNAPGYDGVIELLDASLTSISCQNSTGAGLIETINANGLTAGGTTYYLRVFHRGTGVGTSNGEFSLSVSEVIAPPTNDNIEGAVSLVPTVGCVTTSSQYPATLSATASPQAVSCSTPDDDVWYSFTATSTGNIITVQSGTGYNAALQVYSSSDNTTTGTLTSMTCTNATGTGGVETFSGTFVLGNTYFVRVYHALAGVGSGNFTICVTSVLSPNCTELTTPANGAAGIAIGTVALAWTAPSADITHNAAVSFDVYTGTTSGALTLFTNTTNTTVNLTGVTYGTYYVRIVPKNAGGSAVGGCTETSFTTIPDPCAGNLPAGDTFATAIDLGTLTNSGATASGDNNTSNCWHNDYTTTSTPGSTSAYGTNDVFYKFVVPDACNTIDIDACTTSFDTYIHLLDSTGARIEGYDQGCSSGNGTYEAGLTLAPGTYYLVLESWSTSATGTYTLDISYTGSAQNTYYVDADGDNYGNSALPTVTACTAPVGYALLNGDCDDTNNAINPGHSEVLYNGIDDNCDGQLDEGFEKTTVLNSSSCSANLVALYTSISAEIKSGVTGYRFEVTNLTNTAAPVQNIDRTVQWFTLTQLASYDYSTTYSIRVMLRVGSTWLGYYGDACTVSTPDVSSPTGGSATVVSPVCGTKLATMSSNISTNLISGVTGYKYRVTRGAEVQELTRTAHWFRLNQLPNYVYGATYTVEVAFKTTGDYTPYGPACTILSPDVPSITSCGQTVNVPSNVYTTVLSGVTQYTFEVTNLTNTSEAVQVINRTNHYLPVTLITGYSSANMYSIRVAVTSTGIQSGYGTACEINVPAPTRLSNGNLTSEFKAVGFPNPFTNNFTLDITTTSEEKVSVMVYDMIGKLLDRVEVNATDNALELGANYPAGVYNVIVSQGEKVETVRMVKR